MCTWVIKYTSARPQHSCLPKTQWNCSSDTVHVISQHSSHSSGLHLGCLSTTSSLGSAQALANSAQLPTLWLLPETKFQSPWCLQTSWLSCNAVFTNICMQCPVLCAWYRGNLTEERLCYSPTSCIGRVQCRHVCSMNWTKVHISSHRHSYRCMLIHPACPEHVCMSFPPDFLASLLFSYYYYLFIFCNSVLCMLIVTRPYRTHDTCRLKPCCAERTVSSVMEGSRKYHLVVERGKVQRIHYSIVC